MRMGIRTAAPIQGNDLLRPVEPVLNGSNHADYDSPTLPGSRSAARRRHSGSAVPEIEHQPDDARCLLVTCPPILGGVIYYPGAQAAQVLADWRDATANAPDELTTLVNLTTAQPAPGLPRDLHGLCCGIEA